MHSSSLLFEPFSLGDLNLNNRVVMAPMTRSFSPGNVPNEQNVEYYRTRAANQVGLIITEGTCINHKASCGEPDVPFFYGEQALAGWKKIVDAVHAEGGKIIPQLWHVGILRPKGAQPDPEVPAYGPSGIVSPGKEQGETMSQQDIDEVIAAYAQGAKDAQALGFDGVEIHGAHGYLIDQFFWDGTNQRTDRYGGSIAQRTQFAVEVVQAIKAATGPDFPVVLRWSQWKLQDYSAKLAHDPQQLEEFLTPLVAAGVDIFHCSTRRFWEPEFEGSDLNLAGWVKKITGKPTISVGSVGLDSGFVDEEKNVFVDQSKVASLDGLLQRLADDEFDLVGVGRALIANPDWVVKVRQDAMATLKPYAKKDLETLV